MLIFEVIVRGSVALDCNILCFHSMETILEIPPSMKPATSIQQQAANSIMTTYSRWIKTFCSSVNQNWSCIGSLKISGLTKCFVLINWRSKFQTGQHVSPILYLWLNKHCHLLPASINGIRAEKYSLKYFCQRVSALTDMSFCSRQNRSLNWLEEMSNMEPREHNFLWYMFSDTSTNIKYRSSRTYQYVFHR